MSGIVASSRQGILVKQLRAYQQEAIDELWSTLTNSNAALVQAPTGAGKSLIMAEFCRRLLERQTVRICVVVDRKKLVWQNANTLKERCGSDKVGVYCASLKSKDLSRAITVCSVQSIPKDERFDLVICDEAHDIDHKGGRYKQFLDSAKKVVGLTATPYRNDGYIYGKGRVFKNLTYSISMQELIKDGYLVKPTCKRPEHQFDVKGLHVRAGDYVTEELNALVENQGKVKAQVVDALTRLQGRRKVVWHACSIKHAEMIRDELSATGEQASIVHSNLDDEAEEGEMYAFEKGESRHMVFIGILSKGYDFPPIDAVCLMRPTRSAVLYVQVVGRCLRPFPGKDNALVLDYGRVVENLGPVDSPTVRTCCRQKKSEESLPPLKFCPTCLSYIHIAAVECPDCGAEMPRKELKNLTLKAAEQIDLLSAPSSAICTHVEISQFTSKAGNACTRIDYTAGVFSVSAITEYFVMSIPQARKSLARRLASLQLFDMVYGKHHFKEGVEVEYKRDGKYYRVIEVRKRDSERDPGLAQSAG